MNAVAVIAERLLGRADALADELTAAIRRAEPSYDADNLVPVEDLRTSVRNNVVYIFTANCGTGPCGLHVEAPGVGDAIERGDLARVGDHYEGPITGSGS